RVFLDGDLNRQLLVITHDFNRDDGARANLSHLVHGFQRRDRWRTVDGKDNVVHLDTCVGRRAARRHFVDHNPLDLIDTTALRMHRRDFTPANTDVATDHAAITD